LFVNFFQPSFKSPRKNASVPMFASATTRRRRLVRGYWPRRRSRNR
jgi:hypothetical protein